MTVTLNVRLGSALERELDAWCAAHSTTRTGAVKQALARLLAAGGRERTPYELGKDGFGADASPGRRIARRSQRALRREFRGRSAR